MRSSVNHLIAVGLLLIFAPGCDSSNTPGSADDARRFAVEECSRLAASEKIVLQTEDGKWQSQFRDVCSLTPAWPKEHEVKILYFYRTLQSAKFDTEVEARDADLLPINEELKETTVWYAFEDGNWIAKDH